MSIPHVLFICYTIGVPIVILAALYAFRWKVGMWGNAVTLGAMQFSILIAIGWWEDIAELLVKQAPVTLFFADCVAIWTLFLVSFLILDMATRFLSRVKVKFSDTVEKVGNGIIILVLCGTLIDFVVFANGILGMVGNDSDTAPKPNRMDTHISIFRILSEGNLSGFSQCKPFDADKQFRQLHWERTQALMCNRLSNEGEIQGMQGSDSLSNQMKRR